MRALCLSQVLDEADQLLEMGFRPAIERVLSESCLTACLTACLPPAAACRRLRPA